VKQKPCVFEVEFALESQKAHPNTHDPNKKTNRRRRRFCLLNNGYNVKVYNKVARCQ
jgi:hypothetical protein